ncbi:hypothetical protein IMY05_C1197000500 [Salix suchowensis]|nr:hypothetical protein IMY05_C1197000500 [Salix suchowensis]
MRTRKTRSRLGLRQRGGQARDQQASKKAVPILAATSKPQKKAVTATGGSVEVVESDDSDDERVRPAARKLQRKAQVVSSNDSDDKSVPSTATVAIKQSPPDQPSDDEDEQVQIHPPMKRQIARIQSPESSAERGVEPETPHQWLRRSLVVAGKLPKFSLNFAHPESDSRRAAEASKATDARSSTSKAAPPVPDVAATIAEPESPTPVAPKAALKSAVEGLPLTSEAAPPDAPTEAAGPKRHKTKRVASSSKRGRAQGLSSTSKAVPPDAEAPVAKRHKTKHGASSDVLPKALSRSLKTKNATTSSTDRTSRETREDEGSATSSTSEVSAKRSKTKHATGSTTEAARPPPVLKRTKTKDPTTVKRTKTGNDKGAAFSQMLPKPPPRFNRAPGTPPTPQP